MWSMAWRDHTQRGHHTNNFCEVNVRLYKDLVLSRCKAYNITTLVDFTVTKLESYYNNRLLKFAHSRNTDARLMLQCELKRAEYITSESMISNIGEGTFAVPSQTDSTTTYVVNTSLGTCQCAVGKHGSFCKHQAAVWKYFTHCGPSLPPVTSADRHQMAVLALGSAAKEQAFYADLALTTTTSSGSETPQSERPATTAVVTLPVDDARSRQRDDVITDADGEDVFSTAVARLRELHDVYGSSAESTQTFLRRLNRVKSRGDWEAFLQSGTVPVHRRAGSNIHVQPTAVERRRPGVTRGCKRLHAGRPPVTAERRKRAKLMHALSRNVRQNKCNAKIHGRAH